MVVLASSDKATGVALVQTMNLDGETNLKRRAALSESRKVFAEGGVQGLKALVQAEGASTVSLCVYLSGWLYASLSLSVWLCVSLRLSIWLALCLCAFIYLAGSVSLCAFI